MKYSIIIPCYNEGEGIKSVLENLPNHDGEIIVVDNDSTDYTVAIAQKAGVRVVFEKKRGYGSALKAGFNAARGTYIITLDGDGQYPGYKVEEIIRHAEKNNYDFLSCSRFPAKNKHLIPTAREIGNHFLTTLGNILFSLHLKDNQSGMFVFRRKIYNKIAPKSSDMPLSQEIKIRAFYDQTLKCGEVWIPYSEKRLGNSKLSIVRHGLMNTTALFLLWLELTIGIGKQKPKKVSN